MAENRNYTPPVIGVANRAFWEGLRENKFLLQKCIDCEEIFFPPRLVCPECLSEKLIQVESRGTGTLYAFTEIHVPMLGFDPPYVLGCIELDEKPGRFISRIEAPLEDLRIGLRMKVKYTRVSDDLTLHNFIPDE